MKKMIRSDENDENDGNDGNDDKNNIDDDVRNGGSGNSRSSHSSRRNVSITNRMSKQLNAEASNDRALALLLNSSRLFDPSEGASSSPPSSTSTSTSASTSTPSSSSSSSSCDDSSHEGKPNKNEEGRASSSSPWSSSSSSPPPPPPQAGKKRRRNADDDQSSPSSSSSSSSSSSCPDLAIEHERLTKPNASNRAAAGGSIERACSGGCSCGRSPLSKRPKKNHNHKKLRIRLSYIRDGDSQFFHDGIIPKNSPRFVDLMGPTAFGDGGGAGDDDDHGDDDDDDKNNNNYRRAKTSSSSSLAEVGRGVGGGRGTGGSTTVGNLSVLDPPLNFGSFGRVHTGVHAQTRERFALKIIDRRVARGDASSLRNELRALRRMDNHPNVVGYHGTVLTNTDVCVVLELGHSDAFEYFLRDRVRDIRVRARPSASGSSASSRLERLAVRDRAHEAFLVGTLRGIAALHDARICHLDIKLENILVSANVAPKDLRPNHFKIADFGLSHMEEQAEKDGRDTSSAEPTEKKSGNDDGGGEGGDRPIRIPRRVGTLGFAAPEMMIDLDGCDGRKCDLWSLGACIGQLTQLLPMDHWIGLYHRCYPSSPREFVLRAGACLRRVFGDSHHDDDDDDDKGKKKNHDHDKNENNDGDDKHHHHNHNHHHNSPNDGGVAMRPPPPPAGCRLLMNKLLRLDPTERPTAREALSDRTWRRRKNPSQEEAEDEKEDEAAAAY